MIATTTRTPHPRPASLLFLPPTDMLSLDFLAPGRVADRVDYPAQAEVHRGLCCLALNGRSISAGFAPGPSRRSCSCTPRTQPRTRCKDGWPATRRAWTGAETSAQERLQHADRLAADSKAARSRPSSTKVAHLGWPMTPRRHIQRRTRWPQPRGRPAAASSVRSTMAVMTHAAVPTPLDTGACAGGFP